VRSTGSLCCVSVALGGCDVARSEDRSYRTNGIMIFRVSDAGKRRVHSQATVTGRPALVNARPVVCSLRTSAPRFDWTVPELFQKVSMQLEVLRLYSNEI